MTAQIDQLRNELTSAQSQAASTSMGLSGLSQRVAGMNRDMTALESLVGGYTSVCSQDLTGPSGPAQFYFPCQQKG